MRVDGNGCDVPIEWAHHLSHQGSLFGLSLSKSLSAAGTFMAHIKTPATKQVHFVAVITSNLGGTLLFRRGDVIGETGTAKTAVNYNENSPNECLTEFLQDGTVDPAGVVLKTIIVGGGSPSSRIGGEGRIGTEYVLLPDTLYTLIFTADGNNTVTAMNIDIYEV